MKYSKVRALLCALPLFGLAASPVCGIAAESAKKDVTYAGLQGEVLLDNARVLVQKFVIQPGQSTGSHTHPADQLLVFIKGGVLRSQATGRSTLWREGRVSGKAPRIPPTQAAPTPEPHRSSWIW
jgi:quercetin dioxygenase-like cupin family protein